MRRTATGEAALSREAQPRELLDVARRLTASTSWNTSFWATRAVALLVRQAVETWLAQYWEATASAVARSPRRAQFLLLHDAIPRDAAAEAYATWGQLSRACHHRTFGLEPSRHEALCWIAQAERFGDALSVAHRARP